ncbi:hypothetical protein [Alkalicoccobacillus murimartini]|uniref:Lipoprotein n=1 Tax=Alkalicoccobacillus murimartini TaxID=171685 RepID=A0ABT9YIM0_9BACI|nr:hypothetical protein [Alkalicoccobacillus murimartini]MDQ0207534.1 hypothetical protein [Alkalicoccobacillus murimartini]
MKSLLYLISCTIFLMACGNPGYEPRYFSGESEHFQGEIELELKPTTEATFETAHVELTYSGEGEYKGSIRIETIEGYGIPSTSSGASPNEEGVYMKEYGNYGVEGAYENGGNFGIEIHWRDGGEEHSESIYFEEMDDS